jgi:hypothetical protein
MQIICCMELNISKDTFIVFNHPNLFTFWDLINIISLLLINVMHYFRYRYHYNYNSLLLVLDIKADLMNMNV